MFTPAEAALCPHLPVATSSAQLGPARPAGVTLRAPLDRPRLVAILTRPPAIEAEGGTANERSIADTPARYPHSCGQGMCPPGERMSTFDPQFGVIFP